MTRFAIMIAATMGLAACGGEDGSAAEGTPTASPGAATPTAPAAASAPVSGPVATAPPATPSRAAAVRAFGANCVTCHGASGAGDGSLVTALKIKPRSFAADEWRFVDFTAGDAAVRTEIERVIREGIPDAMMTDYGNMFSDRQIAGLVDYVLELRKKGRDG